MASVIRGSDNFDSAGGAAMKAWVNFDGTGTVAIRAQYNVSSITDLNTGSYRVNFTTAMPDANYSAVCTGLWTGGPYTAVPGTSSSYLTTSLSVVTGTTTSGAGVDLAAINVAIFR